jgi:anti-anti-sigma factor
LDYLQPFEIQVRREGDAALVVPVGDLDSSTASSLDRAIQEALDEGARRVVLDLAGVEYVDSRGLDLLIRATERATGAGAELVLRRANRQLRRARELIDTEGVLRLED